MSIHCKLNGSPKRFVPGLILLNRLLLKEPTINRVKYVCLLGGLVLFVVFSGLSEESKSPSPYARDTSFVGDVSHLAFQAVERREHFKLKTMLDEGLSANIRTEDGTTLLMYAALHGDAEGVKLLLQSGAEPNHSNEYGATPLIWGAGDIAKVRLLVEAGADVNAQSKSGITPLGSACGHLGGAESVRYLLNVGADDLVKVTSFLGLSPIGIAAYVGNFDAVKLLLGHRDSLDEEPPSLSNALHAAVSCNHSDIALYLLDWNGPGKIDPNGFEDRISDALAHSNSEMAAHLVEHGGGLPGIYTAAYSDLELDSMVSKLIQQGADVHQKTKDWKGRGYSALDLARMRGHQSIERLLIQEGVESGRPPKRKRIPDHGMRLTSANKDEMIARTVERSLALLMRSSDRMLKNRFQQNCNSCHHQDLPFVAAGIALSKGLNVPVDSLNRIHNQQIRRWNPRLSEAYEANLVTNEAIKTGGYLLWGRSTIGLPANPITKSVVWFLASQQLPAGHWAGGIPRMPISDGTHMSTALAIRALQMYPIVGRKKEFKERVSKARQWLETHSASILTHKAFRLLGMAWSGSDRRVMKGEIEAMLELQKADGGWSQLERLESDAWATGISLFALHAAGVDTDDTGYMRGMEFLVNTQFEDGSWFVRSRSKPFLPHFDSGFPFGWDQWISAGATAIASASLALALDPVEQEVIDFTPVSRIGFSQKKTDKKEAVEFRGKRTIDFETQVRPILEEYCMDCHSGEDADGQFRVSTRMDLWIGGLSGISAIIPGNAEDSPIIRHVTDAVEDMEMPPLLKRKTYPALTQRQVETLKAWINEGAGWPAGVVLQ